MGPLAHCVYYQKNIEFTKKKKKKQLREEEKVRNCENAIRKERSIVREGNSGQRSGLR